MGTYLGARLVLSLPSCYMGLHNVTSHTGERTRLNQGSKTFFLKPNSVGFWVLLGFFGQAGKNSKIIQKLSNLKP